MTDEELEQELDIERLRRKRDQAWEMAGLARADRDMADAYRHSEIAQRITKRLLELQ